MYTTLAALAVALMTLLPFAGTQAGRANALSRSSCAVSRQAFLTQRDLGAFTLMVSLPYSEPPWKGGLPGVKPPLFYTQYVKGRIVGYIADVALHGPDVAAERARERRLRYKGKWPLVPLEGPIVRHNPGLLEVYETIHDFKTVKAAVSWLRFGRTSLPLDKYAHQIALPTGATRGLAWAGTMGPDKPFIEHVVSYHIRYGTRIIELSFQGGSAVQPALVQPYWRIALMRFARSCGA